MAVRYEGGIHGVTGVAEPDLELTDDLELIANSNTGSNMNTGYMGRRSVLLEWHKADPVDAAEQRRNDVVAEAQGNRNPFVDHPEYVDFVFGDGLSGGGNEQELATPEETFQRLLETVQKFRGGAVGESVDVVEAVHEVRYTMAFEGFVI